MVTTNIWKCCSVITESSYKLFNLSGLWIIYLLPNTCPETYLSFMRKKSHSLPYAVFHLTNLSVDAYSNTQNFTVSSYNFLQHCFSFHFPVFPVITTLVLRYLLCPSTQHIFSILHHHPLLLIPHCLPRFLFILFLYLLQSHLPQAVFFLPYLYFISAPPVGVYVIHALHFVKMIYHTVLTPLLP